jgi:hypothetical protein
MIGTSHGRTNGEVRASYRPGNEADIARARAFKWIPTQELAAELADHASRARGVFT